MNIIKKINRQKIIYTIVVLFVLVLGAVTISTNVFGLFSDKSPKAKDADYPDWPVFNIQKEIKNDNYKFKIGDTVNIEITVKGTQGAIFKLEDQPLGVSDYDKGMSCIPSSPVPSAANLSSSVSWDNQTMNQTSKIFEYRCVLTDDSAIINSNDLPEIIVGQTKITYSYNPPDGSDPYDLEYYGGTRGNEAIINYLTQDNNPDDFIGFDPDALVDKDCYTDSQKECYKLTPAETMFGLMRGRSYVGNVPVTEVASLVYPPGVIIGDTYNENLDNFYYYGRNLKQNSGSGSCSGSGCASWVVSGSGIQSGVQSYYDEESGFLKNLRENLSGEAEELARSSLNNLVWNLTAQDNTKFNIINYDIDSSYPDGKVWVVDGNTTIDYFGARPEHKYQGLGTIFVKGNLTIKEDILPENQSEDFLGFIVTGDVTIADGADVDAAIISGGTIKTSGASRAQLTGSFVASRFEFNTVGTIIKYRIGLENHWPPGFRYIKMPVPEKSF